MDKRARQRLLIVTGILLVVIVALVWRSSSGAFSYYKRVGQLIKDKSLVGVPVRVGGKVVKGSIARDSKGYHFKIADKGTPLQLAIDYDGVMPQTFNESVEVYAEGVYKNGQFKANKIITKCPTKYKPKKT